MKLSRIFSLLVASVVLAVAPARAAVGFSVSPSVISNDYKGVITLTITGLANGQTVRIEKAGDYNLNGALDAGIGEPVIEAFLLKDGKAPPTFGGVANSSAAADVDGATNGAITARLVFANGSESSRGTGHFLYRVVDPGNSAVLASQVLTVNQVPRAQRITGTVTAAAGGAGLSNAFVIVLGGPNGNLLASTLSDVTGAYSMQMPVGNYQVNAIKPGFITDFSQSTPVNLTAGQVVPANVQLTAAPRTVSGRVTDSATGQGVGGLQLSFGGDKAPLSIGFTDGAGNYSIGVSTGPNSLEISPGNLNLLSYAGPPKDLTLDTTAGNVTGFNVTLTNATALVWGVLTNNLGQGIGGIEIKLSDPNLTAFRTRATTDSLGRYWAGVVAGNLSFNLDNHGDLAALGLLPSPANLMSGTVAANAALQVNFLAVPPAAHLRGRVLDESSVGVAGLSVYASPQNSGGSFNALTGADGSFDIGVLAGGYYLGISNGDLAQRGLVASQLSVTVVDGVDQNNLVIYTRAANRQITGRVTGGGTPLANVQIFAEMMVNTTNFNASATTDGSGNYSLGVFAGSWRVSVNSGDLSNQGFFPVNEQIANLAVGNAVVNFSASAPTAYFRGQVRDENNNPIGNVNVFAIPSGGGGNGITAQTDASGNFALGVSAGDYSVGVSTDVSSRNLVPESALPRAAVDGVDQNGITLRVHTATRRISGVVTGNGSPLAGVNVFASRSGFAPFYNANATTDAAGHFDLVVFDDSWNVGVSGSDLANRGLPGVGNRTVSAVGADATVNFIILSSPVRPQLQVLPRVGGKFQVRILGEIGPRYLLESSLSFPPVWNPVLDTNSPAASFDVIDPNSGVGTPKKFYRVNVTQ